MDDTSILVMCLLLLLVFGLIGYLCYRAIIAIIREIKK